MQLRLLESSPMVVVASAILSFMSFQDCHVKMTPLKLPLKPFYGFVPPLSLSCLPQALGQRYGH